MQHWALPGPAGNTNYHAALSQTAIIQQDILDHPKESQRTTYVVMFMSDGVPTDGPMAQYISMVDRFASFKTNHTPMDVCATFNTAWLMNGGWGPASPEVCRTGHQAVGHTKSLKTARKSIFQILICLLRGAPMRLNLVVSNVHTYYWHRSRF